MTFVTLITVERITIIVVSMASIFVFDFEKCARGRLVELIIRFRIELVSDSTVYTISYWFHATFRVFSFENAKTV